MARAAIRLRAGAKTPMARVYQRRFNETHTALAQQFKWRVIGGKRLPVSLKARGTR